MVAVVFDLKMFFSRVRFFEIDFDRTDIYASTVVYGFFYIVFCNLSRERLTFCKCFMFLPNSGFYLTINVVEYSNYQSLLNRFFHEKSKGTTSKKMFEDKTNSDQS